MLKLVNIFPLFHVQDHVDFWNKPHQYDQQKLMSFSYLAWIQVHQQGFSHLYVNSHQQTSGEPWFGAPWGLILECPYHFPGQTQGNPIYASWNGFFKTLMSIVWVENRSQGGFVWLKGGLPHPNCFLQNQGARSFIILGNGLLNLNKTNVYISALGLRFCLWKVFQPFIDIVWNTIRVCDGVREAIDQSLLAQVIQERQQGGWLLQPSGWQILWEGQRQTQKFRVFTRRTIQNVTQNM